MAPRAYWKGFLRLSLVSCPIQLFPATSESEKIRFNQINKETGNRIRYRKVDEETGEEVPSENIIKGYEIAKGQYVEITDGVLATAKTSSDRHAIHTFDALEVTNEGVRYEFSFGEAKSLSPSGILFRHPQDARFHLWSEARKAPQPPLARGFDQSVKRADL